MKKLLSVILTAAVLFSAFCFNSYAASDAYKATWNLKTSVIDAGKDEAADKANFTKGGNTVYDSKTVSNVNVYPGQVVWVTVHLKTGSSYYAGVFQGNVYYSTSIFQSAKSRSGFVWNTSGRYTSLCEYGYNVYNTIIDTQKPKGYPSSWSDSQKKANEYYLLSMTRSLAKSTAGIANIDEDLVSFPIYVKADAKPGTKGEIFITQDDLRTPKNSSGKFFLTYWENGDYNKEITKSDKISHDTSKAKITYTVVSREGDNPAPAKSVFQKILDFIVKYILFGWLWNK